MDQPTHLDIKRDQGITIEWPDGNTVFYPVAHLRKLSPSAEAREVRREMDANPLAILPASVANASSEPLTIQHAELVGRYALKITFSDGHDTGLYSWEYLREIAPASRDTNSQATAD